MRVKKLEIFGFKSFAQKQGIVFGEGVTGIVGPNGCGKSNVVDALRWVMGEQNARHLRGGNMQDIIFCGSEKKAPLGLAEVTLTLDNSTHDAPLEYNHFTEIEITRRIYKTGESEYEINKQKARLKDISDFFLGTGVGTKAYSIIEQGRVNDIISSKPIDRRLIIEEAAGITKYKAKKNAAERRMEATRVNLHRIIDIKNEVDKRVAALAREKEKLDKVTALKDRIRQTDLHVATHRYLHCSATLTFLRTSREQLSNDVSNNNREIAVLEHNFTKILEEYANNRNQRRLLEDLENQHRNSCELLKKDLEHTKATRANNHSLIGRLSAQLEDISGRKSEIEKDILTFETEHRQHDADHQRVAEQLKVKLATGQSVMVKRDSNMIKERDIQRKIVDAATLATRLQTEISHLRGQEEQHKIDARNFACELGVKIDELSTATSRIAALTMELEQGSARKIALQENAAELEQAIKDSQSKIASLKVEARVLEDERAAQSMRVKSLKEIVDACDWSDSGVVDLLSSPHKHLIKGVIANIIQAKPGCENTVEKCLGHLMSAAIVSNTDDLKEVARLLRINKSEEAQFFLLSEKDAWSNTAAKPLGLKSLSELITIAPEYVGLKNHFSRIFLADSLDDAIAHWPAARMAQATIIATEGSMLLSDGRAVILSDQQGKGVLLRKNEITTLEASIAKSAEPINALAEKVAELEMMLSKLVLDKQKIEEELKPLIFGVVRLEETIKQKQSEHTKLAADVQKIEERCEQLTMSAESFDEKIAEKTLQWSQALEDHKNHEEAHAHIRDEKAEVDAEYDNFLQEIKQIEIEKAQALEKSRNLASTLGQLQKTLDHIKSQQLSFEEQVGEKASEELILKETERQTEMKLEGLSKEIDETVKMLVNVRAACLISDEKKETSEQILASHKSRGQSFIQRSHELDLIVNNKEHELVAISERIKEKYRIKLTDHLIDFHLTPIDEQSAMKEMDDLRKQRDRLGAVNENAGVEFTEFDKRSKFLDVQVQDLTDGLAQLENAIKKINKTTQIRFEEAFTNINKQFSKVFPRLFNGGKAELVLTDKEDLLNSGVEIMAKPPGKNIGSIELMSGGEKALTAISLIMAIFLIKPSPFCLLDEVDAPLDETNVARFSQLVKEMSARSQFIVITHNRKTMESADQLYGVTMEDAGQSKIVSVHVKEAFETLRQANPDAGISKSKQLSLDDALM